jgi:probable rRNA maturation factor
LSWPSEERGAEVAGDVPDAPEPGEADDPESLGDIAISYDTCAAEAVAAGKPLEDHVTHLVVHGLLHLLGYDHVRDADGDLMEATEVRILARLGLSDPYSD